MGDATSTAVTIVNESEHYLVVVYSHAEGQAEPTPDEFGGLTASVGVPAGGSQALQLATGRDYYLVPLVAAEGGGKPLRSVGDRVEHVRATAGACRVVFAGVKPALAAV
jgi:hypothetical protein